MARRSIATEDDFQAAAIACWAVARDCCPLPWRAPPPALPVPSAIARARHTQVPVERDRLHQPVCEIRDVCSAGAVVRKTVAERFCEESPACCNAVSTRMAASKASVCAAERCNPSNALWRTAESFLVSSAVFLEETHGLRRICGAFGKQCNDGFTERFFFRGE